VFQAVQGLVGIFENEFYVATRNYLFRFDATTWGWIHLILGLLVAFAGWGLLSGRTWARTAAIFLMEVAHLSNLTKDEAVELGSKVGALIGLGIEGEEGPEAGRGRGRGRRRRLGSSAPWTWSGSGCWRPRRPRSCTPWRRPPPEPASDGQRHDELEVRDDGIPQGRPAHVSTRRPAPLVAPPAGARATGMEEFR
jgi:hypothetical protein